MKYLVIYKSLSSCSGVDDDVFVIASINISEELIASDFMVTLGYPDNLGSKPIWNILTHSNPHWVKSKETDLVF
jgi:hypothetical protein